MMACWVFSRDAIERGDEVTSYGRLPDTVYVVCAAGPRADLRARAARAPATEVLPSVEEPPPECCPRQAYNAKTSTAP